LINAFSTQFSQSPKHSNLAGPPSYLHNLLYIQSNTCTRFSTTVTLKRPSVFYRLKITDNHLSIMHLFFEMLFQKNFANLPFIFLTLVNLALLLYFLKYAISRPTSQFNSKLQTHLIHRSYPPLSVSLIDVTSLALLTWLQNFDKVSSHIHFYCIILNNCIHLIYGLLNYTVSGNKTPQTMYVVGFL